MAKCIKKKNTHRKAGKRLVGRLIIVDNADTTLATRVVIKEPKGVIRILFIYRDGQDRTGSARLGVSEVRVETIDGDVCLMCGDAGVTKSRLCCRVVPVRDCGIDQIMTTDTRETYS
jgi:hypothetical protein